MEDLEKKPVETTEPKVETEPKKEEVKTEEKVEVPTEPKAEEPMGKTETEPKKEEVTEQQEEPKEEEPKEEVEEESTSANGIRIEDIVTREELTSKLDAINAKLEAFLQENIELKEKLAQVKSKYEDNDFGGEQRQGIDKPDKVANDTFAEYAKRFM